MVQLPKKRVGTAAARGGAEAQRGHVEDAGLIRKERRVQVKGERDPLPRPWATQKPGGSGDDSALRNIGDRPTGLP